MLENIFFEIISMSITASVAAVLVVLFRWIFQRKLSKAFNYALWIIVFLRLVIPVSLVSPLSIFDTISVPKTIIVQSHGNGETGSQSVAHEKTEYGVTNIDSTSVNTVLGKPKNSKSTVLPIVARAWMCGVVGLMLCGMYAYFIVSRKLKQAVLYTKSDLVYQCRKSLGLRRKIEIYTTDKVNTPVVCGILKAHIILPVDIVASCSELELRHIITHELVHIKRYDYLIKPLAALILCIHWFNPIMWLCFRLFQKDMEMSCDERVLYKSDADIRSEYASSLLSISIRQNNLASGSLLAFGENNIKSRIKGIMKFKNKKIGVTVIAVIILIAISFILLTNGKNDTVDNMLDGKVSQNLEAVNIVSDMMEHRTQNIGNVDDVVSLLKILTYGNDIDKVSLETENMTNSITIDYKLDNVDGQLQNVKPVLIDNALIIFSLIEDASIIKYKIISEKTYEFNFARNELQQYFERELWSYSNDKDSYYEFIMDLSFEILVYPKKYSPAMSIVPGMQIDVSLNAVYYDFDKVVYSTQNKSLRTMKDGKVSDLSSTISIDHGPVYWLPHDMNDNEDTITISILDKIGNTIIQKTIEVVKENNHYAVKPSYDIITDNLYQ